MREGEDGLWRVARRRGVRGSRFGVPSPRSRTVERGSRRRDGGPSAGIVDVASMAYLNDDDLVPIVVDFVEDSIRALADSIPLLS